MRNNFKELAILLSLVSLLAAQEEQVRDPDVEAFYGAVKDRSVSLKIHKDKIRQATVVLVEAGKYDVVSDYLSNHAHGDSTSVRKDSARHAIGETLNEVGYYDAIPDLVKVYKYVTSVPVTGGESGLVRGAAIHSTHGAIVSLAQLSDLGPYSVESRIEVFERYVEENFPLESSIKEDLAIVNKVIAPVSEKNNMKHFLWLLMCAAICITLILRLRLSGKKVS